VYSEWKKIQLCIIIYIGFESYIDCTRQMKHLKPIFSGFRKWLLEQFDSQSTIYVQLTFVHWNLSRTAVLWHLPVLSCSVCLGCVLDRYTIMDLQLRTCAYVREQLNIFLCDFILVTNYLHNCLCIFEKVVFSLLQMLFPWQKGHFCNKC
jgi:hypothetical protein